MNLKTRTTVVVILLFALLFLGLCSREKNSDYHSAKTAVVIRKIGHEVLLLAGDRTSRVLPVEKIGANHYRLQFEGSFSFIPDSLIRTIDWVLQSEGQHSNYVVQVLECRHRKVVYGYSMSHASESILPCSNRKQPNNCYIIELLFEPSNRFSVWFIGLIVFTLVLLVGIVWFGVRKNAKNKRTVQPNDPGTLTFVVLGNYQFYHQDRYLLLREQQIRLTVKQTQLLTLFAAAPNAIIERSTLMKEVWENEGVIVGRSLDVFISQLRKLFEADDSVRLINVHGRGYKLEVT